VRQAVLLNGILQRTRDVFLAHHVVKRLGAVFSGKNRIAHNRSMAGFHSICQWSSHARFCLNTRGVFNLIFQNEDSAGARVEVHNAGITSPCDHGL